jgi:crotonobetainyl-CoA:carnitine CoA-transferase CaiB-like acyl-CoA transferase
MQDSAVMNPALLSGVRVLDLSIWRPGPYATSLLVALGADVLKVEPPGGDPMRQYADLFESINAGKRSIELDLKDGDDRQQALALAAEADVLVEGFRPGVMARLGLGVDTVRGSNPALVYCSISGYGQDDPRAELPGHDVNYQAWAGALAPDGGTPRVSPLPIADLAGGMAAAFGICAALSGRNATGEGTYLDVSMTDVLATWTGRVGSNDGDREGNSSQGGPVPGYGIFDTADGGQVALGVISEQHFWSSLCAELGLDDLAPLPFEDRSARGAEMQQAVAAAIAGRCRDELVAAFTAAAVPVAPVLDREGMVASVPFPAFPIRLPLPEVGRDAPHLDEHRGQGFR